VFWTLMRKDFVRRRRSPAASLVMLAFPLMMAGLIGMVSGDGGQSASSIRIFLLDEEDGVLGRMLLGAGGGARQADGGPRLEIVQVGQEGFARMERGEASAMLIIPERFTDRLLDGEDVTLQLVRNPAESIKPEIVEQGVEVLATYLDVLVKTVGPGLGYLRDLVNADAMPPVMLVTAITGEIYGEMKRAEPILFPPVVRIESVKDQDDRPTFNIFGYILVMVSVMSVLFVAIRAVTDLYEDQRTGMLRRQLATPLPIGLLVVAKIAFAVAFGVAVMAILILVGALLGWLPVRLPLLSVLVHATAFALAAAGLMAVLMALVRNEKQAGILSWIVVMLMSAFGGSMFPAEFLPAAVRQFSYFTLNYWAVEGFLDLMVRGAGPLAALPATALLLGLGVVLVGVGQWLMQRRLQEALR
jgi:ABC-2 type transport system permease protein